MAEDTEDHLLKAKKELNLVYADLSLTTITSRLITSLQKEPKKCDVFSESALILMQSLPEKTHDPIDNDHLDLQGK